MEFIVEGADATTGKDVSVHFEAGDRAAAEALARAAGIFVSDVRPVRPGPRRRLLGTAARRRVTLASAVVVLAIPLLAWWINVKDDLVVRRDLAAVPRPATQTPSGGPTAASPPSRGWPGPPPDAGRPVPAQPAARPSSAGRGPDGARSRFLKTTGGRVWGRTDRETWLRSNRGARLVAREAAAGFEEYVDEQNLLAKQHAVFVEDRMVTWELMVARRDEDHAGQEVRRFEDALGPADTDVMPASLSAAERSTALAFRQWEVDEADRRILVRCMVRETSATARDGTELRPIYFQQTFVDLDAFSGDR